MPPGMSWHWRGWPEERPAFLRKFPDREGHAEAKRCRNEPEERTLITPAAKHSRMDEDLDQSDQSQPTRKKHVA